MDSQDNPCVNFRSFVQAMMDDGDIVEINDECDPNLEVGAIIRRVVESNDKAPLFNNLKGQDANKLWRILGAPNSLRRGKHEFGRLARHLNLPTTASMEEILNTLMEARSQKPIPPRLVTTGPCKEFKLDVGQFDLTKLPCPQLHRADGGKYVGTYGIHIVQTPDGEWVNWAVARSMVVDANHMTGVVHPSQHFGKVFAMWEELGKDVPWAMVYGAPPAAVMAASMPLPDGLSEADYVGALIGAPLELVKCETNDLLVPTTSEIVFEGTISVTERVPEGPFGEMHGYIFPGDIRTGPLFTVNRITHRKDAIMPVCNPGRITDETHCMIGPLLTAELAHVLKSNGYPVKAIHTPFESQVSWTVIQIDGVKLRKLNVDRETFCRSIGNLVFNEKSGIMVHRVLLVGEDIDVYNFKDVIWAFCTRCRPGIDEYLFEDCLGYVLLPYMGHGSGNPNKGGKMVEDCLMPSEYTTGPNWEASSFAGSFPKDVRQRVLDRWEELGYGKFTDKV